MSGYYRYGFICNIDIIMRLIKKIRKWISKYQFNYYKTLVANFRLFPFQQAVHLPLVIYNKPELKLSRSCIQLNVPTRFGLIKWGNNYDLFSSRKAPSLLAMIDGQLIINGPIFINSGTVFRIFGQVTFGEHVGIGSQCKLLVNNNVKIGSKVRIAFGTIISDSDFHYLYNDGIVHRKNGNVAIGNSVWIGNNVSVLKNAVIPHNAVVSSKSLVNKDFGKYNQGILLAGMPAKIVRENCTQIYSDELDKECDNFFCNNDVTIYHLPLDII